jgi:hypothetical protein
VNPIAGAHTQNVESYNNRIKLPIKQMKGIIKPMIDDYLTEFIFLKM